MSSSRESIKESRAGQVDIYIYDVSTLSCLSHCEVYKLAQIGNRETGNFTFFALCSIKRSTGEFINQYLSRTTYVPASYLPAVIARRDIIKRPPLSIQRECLV